MGTVVPEGMAIRRPRIGLTMYGKDSLGNYRLPADYVSAIVRADGVPVLLPPCGEAVVAAWLSGLDGLVFCGGGDIDPRRYGQEAHAELYGIDSDRDATEFKLLEQILAFRLPVLAICRGMQLINVMLGGTLHQHLPDLGNTRVLHRGEGAEAVAHSVELAPDSLLRNLLRVSRADVVSFHHQAIDRLGRGLVPTAWSHDDVIEAVALPDHGALIAVQWHPEMSASRDARQQALFDWLIFRARKTAASGVALTA